MNASEQVACVRLLARIARARRRERASGTSTRVAWRIDVESNAVALELVEVARAFGFESVSTGPALIHDVVYTVLYFYACALDDEPVLAPCPDNGGLERALADLGDMAGGQQTDYIAVACNEEMQVELVQRGWVLDGVELECSASVVHGRMCVHQARYARFLSPWRASALTSAIPTA